MTIKQAVSGLCQAMIDNNKQVLESFLSDKLTYGHSASLLDSKQSLISDITSNRSSFYQG